MACYLKRRDTPRAIDSFTEIATVHIQLKGSEPPIWRKVEVPTSITLKVLHDIVQVTMGGFKMSKLRSNFCQEAWADK